MSNKPIEVVEETPSGASKEVKEIADMMAEGASDQEVAEIILARSIIFWDIMRSNNYVRSGLDAMITAAAMGHAAGMYMGKYNIDTDIIESWVRKGASQAIKAIESQKGKS